MASYFVVLSFLATTLAAAPDCAKHPLLYPTDCCVETAPSLFSFTWQTTKGPITFSVQRKWSPIGVDRFYNLMKNHYFDGETEGDGNQNAFFRVVPTFVVQFGIAGSPAVSRAWENLNIKDDPVVISNLIGTMAFADAGPNTRTTQVYINLGDNSRLDTMGFTPFANITSGLQNVLAINSKYGEQPDQDAIYAQGDAYLRTNFPGLDYITGTDFHLS